MAIITTYPNFANILEPELNRIFKEEYEGKMVLDAPRDPVIEPGDSITFPTSGVSWTIPNTADGLVFFDNTGTSLEFPDCRLDLYLESDVKEEPPKTYLQLPTGKRLISI